MQKEDRKVYVRESAAPFVSMAEMMKRFQSSTRDLSMQHVNGSLSQVKILISICDFFEFFFMSPSVLFCQHI